VLSPSTRAYDLGEKRAAYRRAKIAEIWFVDPDKHKVIVDRRLGKGYETEIMSKGKVISTVLPGFWIDAAWLWKEPLPNELDRLE
jgi:Uma2 family endonuclease